MNTLQRPLFDAPMPMVEGSGITSMAMDEAAGEQIGAELTAAIAQGVADTEMAIDSADDNVGIMNALRGKQADEEEYRTELAGYVGRKDANATPDSVLALVQPTMAMIELGDAPMGGIADMAAPSTFGVEEEIFGKLPVQKLRPGGEVKSGLANLLAGLPKAQTLPERFASVQELQKQFLPTQADIQQAFAVQQPSTMQNLLAVGAPFVQGLLAPSQQGGGINAALSLASQAAAKQLAQQRLLEQQAKQKTQQALINQRMSAGQSALTAALEADEADTTRRFTLATQLAKKKPGATSTYEKLDQYVRQMEDQFGADSPEATRARQARDNLLVPKMSPEDIARSQMLVSARTANLTAQNKLGNEALTELNERVNRTVELKKQLNSLRQQKVLARSADIGPGSEYRRAVLNQIANVKKIAPQFSGVLDKIVTTITGDKNVQEDELRLAFETAADSLSAARTLAYMTQVPGNLNDREVLLTAKIAGGGKLSEPEIEILEKAYQRILKVEEQYVAALKRGEQKFRDAVAAQDPNKDFPLSQFDRYEFIRDEMLKVQVEGADTEAFVTGVASGDTGLPVSAAPAKINFEGEAPARRARIEALFKDVGQRSAALYQAEGFNSEVALENPEVQENYVRSMLNGQASLQGLRGFKFSNRPKEIQRAALKLLIENLELIDEFKQEEFFTAGNNKYAAPSKATIIAAAKRLLGKLGDD